MQAFWHPDIVAQFKAADKKFADDLPKCKAIFSTKAKTVQDFLAETSGLHYTVKIQKMQEYLLGSLRYASRVGMYSKWWEYSIYVNGYDHPDTQYAAQT